ncbi:translation initiation factor IF-2 [Bubalus bubalis]|uniref:translation initiation factor IF-2 n=1 Tax=Bubalus bubalis TaxID=89462 RepID=UPI001E1B90F7|nr:translation initiation factor IF-2 [Bubalus bubalis]
MPAPAVLAHPEEPSGQDLRLPGPLHGATCSFWAEAGPGRGLRAGPAHHPAAQACHLATPRHAHRPAAQARHPAPPRRAPSSRLGSSREKGPATETGDCAPGQERSGSRSLRAQHRAERGAPPESEGRRGAEGPKDGAYTGWCRPGSPGLHSSRTGGMAVLSLSL